MWQRIQQVLERVFFFAAITVLLTGNAPAPGSFSAQLGRIIGGDQFNFAGWEVEALSEKGKQSVVPIQDYLDDQQRAQFVVDFLDLTRRADAAERKVDSIYSDPAVPDPYAASADQRAERDRLRAELERRRPMAEAIIDEQIASVLVGEGLAVGGRVFPPVQSRITPLPNILVLSPRDEIKREPGVVLSSGLTVDQAEAIENSLFMRLDKSALVTPIGGLAAYPSMIIETPDLLFLLQVMAHEWTHHWLFLRPLGFNLLLTSVSGGDLLTLNETVASLTGNEVGIEILKRYYPDIARRDYPQVYAPRPAAAQPASPPAEPDPNIFSFSREMHKTRVQVDEYLARAHEYSVKADAAQAAGQRGAEASLRAESSQWVVKAETYMEERRKLFLANGYRIRKLNQAYFAFYGSYADQPGASGADPIGPAVVELRRKIPKLSDFLNAVAPVTTLDGLRRVLAQYP
jgi:hypothetical protein